MWIPPLTMANRERNNFIEVPTLLTVEGLALCEDGFADADLEVAERVIAEAADRQLRHASLRAAGPRPAAAPGPAAPGPSAGSSAGPAAPGPAAAVPGPAPIRFPLFGAAEYSLAQMRALFPEHIPIKITRETNWHTRWRATYDTAAKPNAVSKSFGGAVSELHAIARMVLGMYAIISREGGPGCPYAYIESVIGAAA